MLAPASNRNRETALTMPGRSGQETHRRMLAGTSGGAGSLVGAGFPALGFISGRRGGGQVGDEPVFV